MTNSMIVMGTGHRPKHLPCKYKEMEHDWYKDTFYALTDWLEIRNPIVISGMAVGWDIMLARAAKELGLELWAYIPFRGQQNEWPLSARKEYLDLLSYATVTKVAMPGFNIKAYQIRNEMMVQDCDQILALWNGKKYGGTWNCLEYARNEYPDKFNNLINFWR